MLESFALGILGSALIAGVAYARGSLSRAGGLAAVGVGTAIYVGGGPAWFGALVVFFVTSTLLGKVGAAHKRPLLLDYQKGDRRDAGQVLCNGGVAALCALGALFMPGPALAGAFVGALATANGDTWATELGVLAGGRPWSLRTFQPVTKGSSGAVSWLGLAASLAGGLTVGAVAALSPRAFGIAPWAALVVGGAAGLAGSVVDSLLGALLQASYHCPACGCDTESPRHHCGAATLPVRGAPWFDNDAVNLVATCAGALFGALVQSALGAG